MPGGPADPAAAPPHTAPPHTGAPWRHRDAPAPSGPASQPPAEPSEARFSPPSRRSPCAFGGEGGIRTHGPVARSTVFETAPFDRSGTSPVWIAAQVGAEGGIRTHGRVSPTHAFQACSLTHSDTSPGCWQRTPTTRRPVCPPACAGSSIWTSNQGLGSRSLREEKKPRSSAALSSARTPELTSNRWLSRASCTRLPREPQYPAFGSAAPYTSRSILLATRAPAHMGHGSMVTTMVHPES